MGFILEYFVTIILKTFPLFGSFHDLLDMSKPLKKKTGADTMQCSQDRHVLDRWGFICIGSILSSWKHAAVLLLGEIIRGRCHPALYPAIIPSYYILCLRSRCLWASSMQCPIMFLLLWILLTFPVIYPLWSVVSDPSNLIKSKLWRLVIYKSDYISKFSPHKTSIQWTQSQLI